MNSPQQKDQPATLKCFSITRRCQTNGLFKDFGKIQAIVKTGHGGDLLHRKLLSFQQRHGFSDTKGGQIFPHGTALVLLKQFPEIVGVQPQLLSQLPGGNGLGVVLKNIILRRLDHRVWRHVDG